MNIFQERSRGSSASNDNIENSLNNIILSNLTEDDEELYNKIKPGIKNSSLFELLFFFFKKIFQKNNF